MHDPFNDRRDGQSTRHPGLPPVGLYWHLGNLEGRLTDTPFPQPVVPGTRIMRIVALMSGIPRMPATIRYFAERYAPSLVVCVPDFRCWDVLRQRFPVWLHRPISANVSGTGVAVSGDAVRNRELSDLHGRSRKRHYAISPVSAVVLAGAVAAWFAFMYQPTVPTLRLAGRAIPPQQSPSSSASSGPAVAISSGKPASHVRPAAAAVAALRATASPATATSQHLAQNHVRKRRFTSAIRQMVVPDRAVHSGTHKASTSVRQKAGRVVVHAFQHGRNIRPEVVDNSADIRVESAPSRREIRPSEAGNTDWMNHLSQRRITEIPDAFSR